MMRQCDTCYDNGECVTCGECKFYSPLTEEAEDEMLATEVEEGRYEFYEAWCLYISEDD